MQIIYIAHGGFDAAYFYRVFKKYFGVTPRETK